MKLVSKSVILILIFLLFCVSLSGCAKKASTDASAKDIVEQGKIQITVIDKTTKKPVSDAKIVISGIDSFYKTDDSGQSPEISININKDIFKKYGAQLYKKAPSGTVTIFVTKEGYKDYILFDRPVYPGTSANNVSIQLSKLSKNDSEKYTQDIKYPHTVWVQELVDYCKALKNEKDGGGNNKITVTLKDSSSKPVEGAFVSIPELDIKVKSGKDGICILKPIDLNDTMNIYPVKQQFSNYTVVAFKDGYIPSVVFNVPAKEGKEGKVNIVMKPVKGQQSDEIAVSAQAYDKEWVDKIITTFKKQE